MPRILLVDDDPQVRMMLRMLLEDSGYEVEEAGNGLSALKAFSDRHADLIIIDLIMPEKEGLDTIMELKEDSRPVKIIAVSGGGRIAPMGYLDVAQKLGADRVFAKPVDGDELLQAIEELLS